MTAPMFIYFLCEYEEYGPWKPVATLDRSKVVALFDANWSVDEAKPWGRPKRAEFLAISRRRLEEVLASSDDALAEKRCGWDLHPDWGCIRLSVVRLDHVPPIEPDSEGD